MSALWTADELIIAAGGAMRGRFEVSGIAFDTRQVVPGDLFIALHGEARDGHDFVAAALAKGAAGALIDRDVPGLDPAAPVLRVADTLAALGRLGAFARARTRAKIIAVTGSVGKTTTKQMLGRCLAAFGPVHAAQASFNNHLGVPLTLARIPPDAQFAVIEIGMNHRGEIEPLARMARPHVAMVTSIAAAHLGHMGNIEAIAEEKANIFAPLEADGVAVMPRDSPFLPILSARVRKAVRRLTFGEGGLADLRLVEAESDATGCDVTAHYAGRVVRLRLQAPGRHMAMNALAALAACVGLDLDIDQAARALDGFQPVAGRGAQRRIATFDGAALLLDESYNASGASVRAALEVLRLQPGRHVAALGDMLELGDEAESEHRALADIVAQSADLVFACGPMMRLMFADLPAHLRGAWEPDSQSLAPLLKAELRAGDALLVKGSLGSNMARLIALIEEAA